MAKSGNTEKARIFHSWSRSGEERWLESMARSGLLLVSAGRGTYSFEHAKPQKLIYAVEYMAKDPDIPDEIAADCNTGWDYVGRFGHCRYYRRPRDGQELPHPAADSERERVLNRTVASNLTTLFLLNVPGTVYCLLYLIFFFADGRFSLPDLFTVGGSGGLLYLFGALLGIFAMYWFTRQVLRLRNRGRELSASAQSAATTQK